MHAADGADAVPPSPAHPQAQLPKASLQPLPRPVTPYPDETLPSYLHRLARANRLDAGWLRGYLANDHRKAAKVPADRLAALSGIPERTLRYAILELCSAEELADMKIDGRPAPTYGVAVACHLCTLARGCQQEVIYRRQHENVICLRHRRWTGTATFGPSSSQLDLSHQPEILHAAKRHRRLIRRHGQERVNYYAYYDAERIWQQWPNKIAWDEGFYRRMRIFHGDGWSVAKDDATIHAAAYPQIIALTRLLASPYWRVAALENLPRPRRFVAELRRTVAPAYFWFPERPYGHYEPLAAWINQELQQQNGPDLADYRDAEIIYRSGDLDGLDLHAYPLEQVMRRIGASEDRSRRLAAAIRSMATPQPRP
ncbi:TniQ family protein [Streptosporangium amethystogenes]|uniref:TniQ family protein n=1 Tax=Streptosporangium amethystogenes TaxID=2002 RepID=UPI0037A68D15